MDATYFDPIEVPDSTELETQRTLFITPNGDRAIRLKSQYRGVLHGAVPTEVVIDLTPAALRDALNKIPGFTVTYEQPKQPLPTNIGAVIQFADGGLAIRTDADDEPWRLSPARTNVGGFDKHWASDKDVYGIAGLNDVKVLSEGVAL